MSDPTGATGPDPDAGDERTDPGPAFGPGGYLPERASQRARKIMLRAPLGIEWVFASLAAGAIVAVAGLLFLRAGAQPPDAPYVAALALAEVDEATEVAALDVLVVAVGGRVRAFPLDPLAPSWCPDSRRVEGDGGRVWSPTGRALDGGASLDGFAVVVHDGTVYVDPTTITEAPPGAPDGDATPTCRR